jgi:Arc/MetJ family transcription regulator
MWCIVVYMSRTNIDLDDRLVQKVMQMYLLKTKRGAVQLALERLVGGPPMTKDEMLAMEGRWARSGYDEAAFAPEPPLREW